jgi:hypothetical protein
MRLLKYGKYWRIEGLFSAFANISILQNVTKITEEEFDKIQN